MRIRRAFSRKRVSVVKTCSAGSARRSLGKCNFTFVCTLWWSGSSLQLSSADIMGFFCAVSGLVQSPTHTSGPFFLSITESCCSLESLFLFLFICWKAPGQVNTIYQGGFSISNAFCQGSFAYPLVFFFPGRVVRVDKRGNIKGRAPHAEGGAESAECVVNSADQSKRRVLASCGSRTYRFHGAREEIGARAEASASLSCPKLFPQWLGVGDDTSLALPPRI